MTSGEKFPPIIVVTARAHACHTDFVRASLAAVRCAINNAADCGAYSVQEGKSTAVLHIFCITRTNEGNMSERSSKEREKKRERKRDEKEERAEQPEKFLVFRVEIADRFRHHDANRKIEFFSPLAKWCDHAFI